MTPAKIWHPFTQPGIDPPPLRVARAEGVYLHTHDGRRLIDAVSSWWTNLHGHNHPKLMAAIAAQTAKLDHVLLAGCTHDAAEELAAGLGAVLPAGLTRIFFSDDGSTAVEVALKMAVQYWRNIGRPEKRELVALEHGYHGDTAGAMSVGDDSLFTAAFGSLLFPVHRVHSAYCYRCPVGKRRETCAIDCAGQLAQLLAARGNAIAAVIVEPLLQGAGGMIVHPVEFLEKIRALCTAHDVLLIADEVLTGFGRAGRMFACDWAGVAPDLICLSKGITGGVLPLGATAATEQVYEAFVGAGPGRTFYHGHSFTGNPIACAAANANLEIFRTEPVFERIERIAKTHRERLAALRNHPVAGDTRAIGTVAAVEIAAGDPGYDSRLRPALYRFFLEKGVLLRPLGNVIYVLPPYAISAGELARVWDVVAEGLDLAQELMSAGAAAPPPPFP
ncbi:MAG TPA: adenosylmethionine--8-amino-7-oxononanoate transaminase [Candidatus Acidoferrales bacterium]|nr:adenosylmethionine--8-amino-7-oxononanoate transaminase [Candidatus Acidoferrales bacterium]